MDSENRVAENRVAENRVAFVDYAKGISIILVVMMHSTLSSEEALGHTGWLGEVVAFARPFRIPAFFLIAGLFVARGIDRPWREFLDRKVLHFVYFYVLWLSIQFVFRAPVYAAEFGMLGALRQYLTAFVDPFGTLWFIYLLPVFYLAARLLRGLPPALVLIAGAVLEIAPVATGWTLIDEFAGRFVYFYAGTIAGAFILRNAPRTASHRAAAIGGLVAWSGLNLWCVQAGISELPFVSLALGLAGGAAVVVVSALLAQMQVLTPIRYCGSVSLVIYLGFFLPMAATRTALIKAGLVASPSTVAALVTIAAVIVPLAIYWLVRGTALRFLFERPAFARLSRPVRLQPAE
jgi:uncharacterized membrane protein YcfT